MWIVTRPNNGGFKTKGKRHEIRILGNNTDFAFGVPVVRGEQVSVDDEKSGRRIKGFQKGNQERPGGARGVEKEKNGKEKIIAGN
jgi:hypothetical protein